MNLISPNAKFNFFSLFIKQTSNSIQQMVKMASVQLGSKEALKSFIQPITIGLIAWAIASHGFPRAPDFFRELSRNELFQYFLVFAFVWTSCLDAGTALMVTVGMYLFSKILSLRSVVSDVQYQQQHPPQPIVLPPPTSAPPAESVPHGPSREAFRNMRPY